MCSINSSRQSDSIYTWWRHQMETFSALLAICAGNSPVPGEFPTQRPVTRSFDVYFDLRPNEWLSKQSWGWWFEMPSRPLWRHRNDTVNYAITLFQIMDCRLLSTKPLSEPVLTYMYYQPHPSEQISLKCLNIKVLTLYVLNFPEGT